MKPMNEYNTVPAEAGSFYETHSAAEVQHSDVLIIGAGPGGIFASWELAKGNPDLKITVL